MLCAPLLHRTALALPAAGAKVPYKVVDRRAGDTVAVWAATELAEQLLGWKAKLNVADMCRDQWAWATKYPQVRGCSTVQCSTESCCQNTTPSLLLFVATHGWPVLQTGLFNEMVLSWRCVRSASVKQLPAKRCCSGECNSSLVSTLELVGKPSWLPLNAQVLC